MSYTLMYTQDGDRKTVQGSDLAVLKRQACQLLAESVNDPSKGIKDLQIVDDDGYEVASSDDLTEYCLGSSGGGGGGGGPSTRRLEYTVAFFNQGGKFAVVLVDDRTINNTRSADQLCHFLQQQFQQAVLLITNSGKSRGLNHSLVRNFRAHPSQIRGWQKVTLTVPL